MSSIQQVLLATAMAAANTLDSPILTSIGNYAENTAGLTVPAPPSYINGDLLVLIVTSTNQTITTPTVGGTWTQVTNSPQSTGTAGASQSIRIAVFTKIASGAQANVTVTDTGVLTIGQMFAFRKVDQTTPVEVTAGSVLATAGTTHTLPAVTTSTNNALIAHCAGIGRDALLTSGAYTSPTNANLTGLTVNASRTTATANGGGIGMVTGRKVTAGATGTTTVSVASAKGAFVTLGIKPSTNYDSAVRVTGPVADGLSLATISDSVEGAFLTSTASITIGANGSVATIGATSSARSTWLSNSTTGSSYYVRVTSISGSGIGAGSGWLQINTDRTWYTEAMNDGVSNASGFWFLKFEFATDSAGTNIVATNYVELYVVSNVII